MNKTKNPQHLAYMVDWYLRRMGDKTIPDSAEPLLESFYPPFVAGIDLPHQGIVDYYNLYNGNPYTGKMASSHWNNLQNQRTSMV